jgi:hypothetical protein
MILILAALAEGCAIQGRYKCELIHVNHYIVYKNAYINL